MEPTLQRGGNGEFTRNVRLGVNGIDILLLLLVITFDSKVLYTYLKIGTDDISFKSTLQSLQKQ